MNEPLTFEHVFFIKQLDSWNRDPKNGAIVINVSKANATDAVLS